MIAIINPDTPTPVIGGLIAHGFTPVTIPLCSQVQRPIAGHPDVQLCFINNVIIYHPAIDSSFLQLLSHTKYELVRGQSILQSSYPHDCAYNCAYTGKVAFHNTKVTDSSIKEILIKGSDPLIHVNQAYTKCST